MRGPLWHADRRSFEGSCGSFSILSTARHPPKEGQSTKSPTKTGAERLLRRCLAFLEALLKTLVKEQMLPNRAFSLTTQGAVLAPRTNGRRILTGKGRGPRKGAAKVKQLAVAPRVGNSVMSNENRGFACGRPYRRPYGRLYGRPVVGTLWVCVTRKGVFNIVSSSPHCFTTAQINKGVACHRCSRKNSRNNVYCLGMLRVCGQRVEHGTQRDENSFNMVIT